MFINDGTGKGKSGKAKGKGKEKGKCAPFFTNGECKYGDSCFFSHSKDAKPKGKGKAKGKGKRKKRSKSAPAVKEWTEEGEWPEEWPEEEGETWTAEVQPWNDDE